MIDYLPDDYLPSAATYIPAPAASGEWWAITARHYLLAVAKYPGQTGDELLPTDEKLTRAAIRFWDSLTEDERDVLRLYAGEPTEPELQRTAGQQRQFNALLLRFVLFARIVNPAGWIYPDELLKGEEENEPKNQSRK